MSKKQTSDLGQAVQEVAEKAQLVVREEIELAKAEMSLKFSKLIRGAIVGAIAGIFLLTALLFALHGAAWGLWTLILNDATSTSIWVGFVVLAVILVVLGAIAGLVALRLLKRGSPPTPNMAIEEAQLLKATVSSSHPRSPRESNDSSVSQSGSVGAVVATSSSQEVGS